MAHDHPPRPCRHARTGRRPPFRRAPRLPALLDHPLRSGGLDTPPLWPPAPPACPPPAPSSPPSLFHRRSPPATPADLLAPWQTWFLVGPAFLLVGMFAGSLTALIDWAGNPAMVVVEVGALLVGCAYLVQQSTLYQKVRENPARWTSIGFGLFLTVFTVIVLADPTNLVIAGPVALAAIGRLLAASARHDAPSGRSGGALIGGMLLFLITLFAYYSAY